MIDDIRRKRSRLIQESGRTRSYGINVGPYPRHHFRANLEPLPLDSWPLWIGTAGDDEWRAGCYRIREEADFFSVEYVTKGAFRFFQGGAAHDVRAGSLYMVQPGRDSATECLDCREAEKRVVMIHGALVGPLLAALGLDRVDTLTPADPAQLGALYDRADVLLSGPAENKVQKSAQLAFEFLILLSDCRRHDHHPEPLGTILRYLDARLDQPLSIAKLCAEFRLSPASLQRLFRTRLGVSPIAHLIRRRMETAMHLLRFTNRPVKDIAFRVGYANALYFTAEFRKFSGVSPTSFRQRPLP